MRGSFVDNRLLFPDAHLWELANGAYLDGDMIVLPQPLSFASTLIYLGGAIKTVDWRLTVFIPSGGTDTIYQSVAYFGVNKQGVIPDKPIHGNAPKQPTDIWTSGIFALGPGTGVHWMRLSVGGNNTYTTAGTKFKPGPKDLTIT